MNPIPFTRFVVLLLATAAASSALTAQEPAKATAEHKVLMQDVGTWKTKMEMSVPGQDEPMMSEGTEVNESVCNGLFIQSTFKGDMGGMPFEGRSVMGYDKFKKMYTGVWVDNFGTSLYPMEGKWDAAKLSSFFETQSHGDHRGFVQACSFAFAYSPFDESSAIAFASSDS